MSVTALRVSVSQDFQNVSSGALSSPGWGKQGFVLAQTVFLCVEKS